VLRGHRERQRLSLRALADESGLSASFLSQVERGLTDPSVGSLRRIARGLGVRISELLDDGSPAMPGVELARQQDRQTIELTHSGVVIEPFPVTESFDLSAQIRRYSDDVAVASAETAHEDDELLYVVEGQLELVTGDSRAVLGAGDGAVVRRQAPHGLRPVPGKSPRVLVVRSRVARRSNG
jgi:transcriptional regulator with XRE-family HTH domain